MTTPSLIAHPAAKFRQATALGLSFVAAALAITFEWCQRLCMALRSYEGVRADEYMLAGFFLAIGVLATVALRERDLRVAFARLHSDGQQAAVLARTDFLTGLPNRLALTEFTSRASGPNQEIGIVLVDLDGFKGINDRLGHEGGDCVLATLGRRFRSLMEISPHMLAVRLGGDEFAFVLHGSAVRDIDATTHFIEALMSEPVAFAGSSIPVTASIGTARCERGSPQSIEALLRRADATMYGAKRSKDRRARWADYGA